MYFTTENTRTHKVFKQWTWIMWVFTEVFYFYSTDPCDDWGCSTWDYCQIKTVWKFMIFMNEEWKRRNVREQRKENQERWRSKGWPVKWEERKNFSMMKQSVLLSYWPTLPPIARAAPWQQALSPREKQPYRTTPPYFSLPFSLMILSPFPNYKHTGFTSVTAWNDTKAN